MKHIAYYSVSTRSRESEEIAPQREEIERKLRPTGYKIDAEYIEYEDEWTNLQLHFAMELCVKTGSVLVIDTALRIRPSIEIIDSINKCGKYDRQDMAVILVADSEQNWLTLLMLIFAKDYVLVSDNKSKHIHSVWDGSAIPYHKDDYRTNQDIRQLNGIKALLTKMEDINRTCWAYGITEADLNALPQTNGAFVMASKEAGDKEKAIIDRFISEGWVKPKKKK